MRTMLDQLNPVGMRAEYAPSGATMPIEDDSCLDVTCEGTVVETAFDPDISDETWFLVKWDFCCPIHFEMTSGHIPAELHQSDIPDGYVLDYPDWDNRHLDAYNPQRGYTWERSSDMALLAPIGHIR